MTLSPTALEAAAKAVEAAELAWKAANGGDKASCIDCPDEVKATAAITAYLAQAEKEGWVMVPKDATDQMAVAGGIDCEDVIFGGAGNYPTIFDAMKKIYETMIANRPLAAAQNGGE